MRPTAREALGADPMFRAWQDSGGQPHELPRRMRITYDVMITLWVVFLGGIFITLVTGANWPICIPVFVVFLIIMGCIWYFSPRSKDKKPGSRAWPEKKKKHEKFQ